MSETKLYIVRHGKTMFNTIGRAQGWSDTPLTKFGEAGIHELGRGLKAAGIDFKASFSSDSGRTIQTIGIIKEEMGLTHIPYMMDKRIREWCFGSLDGGYDGELFGGVLPRTDAYKGKTWEEMDFETMANGILEVDTANWAEPWEVIRERILTGFEDIAYSIEKQGGGNALIVSHGLTIATFCSLITPEKRPKELLDNGSVTTVTYKNGEFTLEKVGDMSYRQEGKKLIDAQK
ncbi:MAG: phosphoglycerate mutase family protein [Streptococcaceae bacterium]|nr:phosphoglycerate mutase family protein [Streptococcaceae bacterium]